MSIVFETKSLPDENIEYFDPPDLSIQICVYYSRMYCNTSNSWYFTSLDYITYKVHTNLCELLQDVLQYF